MERWNLNTQELTGVLKTGNLDLTSEIRLDLQNPFAVNMKQSPDIKFSNDKRFMVTFSHWHAGIVWEYKWETPVRKTTPSVEFSKKRNILSMGFSANGNLLLVGTDMKERWNKYSIDRKSIKVWEFEMGSEIAKFQ